MTQIVRKAKDSGEGQPSKQIPSFLTDKNISVSRHHATSANSAPQVGWLFRSMKMCLIQEIPQENNLSPNRAGTAERSQSQRQSPGCGSGETQPPAAPRHLQERAVSRIWLPLESPWELWDIQMPRPHLQEFCFTWSEVAWASGFWKVPQVSLTGGQHEPPLHCCGLCGQLPGCSPFSFHLESASYLQASSTFPRG